MLLLLHKLEEDTSRDIEPSISHQNFSILMSSSKAKKLISSKYNTQILLLIFLLKLCPLQHLEVSSQY